MTDFERDVIERLTRIETQMADVRAARSEARSRSWSVWMMLLPIALSVVISLAGRAFR